MRYLQFGLDAVKHAGSTRSAWFVLHAGPLWDKQTWVKVEIALIWVWQWQGKFVHQPTNQSRNSEGPHVCRFDQQCSSQDFSESVPYLEIAEKTRFNGMDIVRFGKLPKAVAQKSCVAVAEFEDYLVWPEILRWQSKSVIFCLSLSPKQFRSLCVHAHWLAACNCQDWTVKLNLSG